VHPSTAFWEYGGCDSEVYFSIGSHSPTTRPLLSLRSLSATNQLADKRNKEDKESAYPN
jgi:hypothetical protein